MKAIRIRKTIDSETLDLPELKPLVGRAVEIIVLEEDARSGIVPATGNWDEAMRAAAELEDYDFDVYRRQHACDLQHAQDQQGV
jgi:hypothetical protein